MQTQETDEPENFSPPIETDFLPSALLPASPDNPPWNSFTALCVWAASMVFILVVPAIFVIPYALSQGILSEQNQLAEFLQNDPTAILLSIVSVIPAHVLTLVLAWLVVTKFNRFSFRETLGWKWNGFNIWSCLAIVGGFYISAAAIGYFFPEQDNELLRILKSSRSVVYAIAFLATFTAPVVEEVVYRGILYSALQRSIGVAGAVFIVTALFAGVHFWQYWGSPGTLILICLLSLILTLTRLRTKNLLPCIALHTVFNGSQSLLLILQPIIQNYIETHQPQTSALVHLFK